VSVHIEIERKFGLLAFAQVALAIACVDTTPVSITTAELDAGVDGEGACVACVEAPNAPGPGCADELAVCFQYEECEGTNAFFGCMLGSCDHVCGVPEVPSGD